MEHSKLPWKVVGRTNLVFHDEGYWKLIAEMCVLHDGWKANAAFIVHCVNMHEELVEALKRWVEFYGWTASDKTWADEKAMIESTRAVLAKDEAK